MKKVYARKLKERAEEICKKASQVRKGNPYGETFEVGSIHPLSESTAYVRFNKSTGKVAVCFFFWVNINGGQWHYMFPTYDHCVGAEKLRSILHGVEEENFKYNFDEDLDVRSSF